MNKFLRVITTAVVGVGLILLFLYLCVLNNVDKADIFSQPSYYVVQNYWYVFLAGCGCIVFGLISCFLSWHKSMDTKIEILPNAVAAQKDEVVNWLTGSSLDTKAKNAASRSQTYPDVNHTNSNIDHQSVSKIPIRDVSSKPAATDVTISGVSSIRTVLDTVNDTVLTETDSQNAETVLETNSSDSMLTVYDTDTESI